MQGDISIKFGELSTATFIERPNRFIVRCRLDESGEVVDAHLADPGRLKELLVPGACLYLRYVNDPRRKTKWSAVLVMASDKSTLVSLQSTLVNQLTAKTLKKHAIPELATWDLKKAEYTYGNSRWDFYLEDGQGKRLLLEVKSCSLVQAGIAMFPDAITARGKRHVQELTKLQASGDFVAALLFVVQRGDAHSFRPADHIDPAFGEALRLAHKQGVQVFVRSCQVSTSSIDWGRTLPVDLS